MSYRKRLTKLARTLTPPPFPDFVIAIEGLEPGGPPACVITTSFDASMRAFTTREVWREDTPG